MSFSKNHSATRTWPTVRLARLSTGLQDGTHGTHERVESGVPLLSAKNVTANGLDIGETESQIAEAEAASIVANGFPRQGDVLLTIVGSIGRSAVYGLPDPLPFQRSVCFIRPATSVDARYLSFALQSVEVQDQIKLRAKSSAQAGLYLGDVASLPIPRPPVEDQRRIAEFLDRESAQIDELIAKQEQLISTLAERRSAVIHSALTRGLSYSTDSRESGVYWLGPIPTEWRVNKFSRVVRINGGQVDPREDRYASMILVAPNHIEKETGRLLDQETAAEQGADSGKYLVKGGQVIYSKIRPALRKATIAPRDCLCSADMYAMSPDPSHVRESFLLYLLLSRPFTQFVTDVSSRVAMPKVNQEALALAYLWYPSLAEQDRIVDHLNSATEKLGDLASKAARVIEVLRERRQALISAAVTGQIDVGGAS